jgi:hypothetical protein
MLILSVSATLAVIVSGFLKARAALSGNIELPPDFQYWTPQMQQNFYQSQQATQGAVFVYVMPLVGALFSLWLGWLIFSGILHLTSTLLGGRGSMGGALNLVAWASLPFVARDALRIIFILISQRAITSPGLSGFVSAGGFGAQILALVDLFYVWYILLLIFGLGVADSLPKGKAIMGVMIAILISLLAQAGMGTLTASLSGLAVQPFF